MSKPLVSIITVTFNSEATVADIWVPGFYIGKDRVG